MAADSMPATRSAMAPEYLAIAESLPGIYQECDTESFDQIDGFLGMVDEILRTYLDRLHDLPLWLSPGSAAWPMGAPIDAGADEVLAKVAELYDALGSWCAFTFPGSWGSDGPGLARQRKFLGKAALVWRRRGTPRGFLDWFCLYFGIAKGTHRPLLLEHFKYGQPEGAAGQLGPQPWLRATLLVPATTQFGDYVRRREAAEFVERYAPSHVLIRLCWVPVGFTLGPVPDPADDVSTEAYRTHVREILCSLVDVVDHGLALHLGNCIDEGRPVDRLDVGRLPTDGTPHP